MVTWWPSGTAPWWKEQVCSDQVLPDPWNKSCMNKTETAGQCPNKRQSGEMQASTMGSLKNSVNLNTLLVHLILALVRGVNSSPFHTAQLNLCLQQGPLEAYPSLFLCSSPCHGTEVPSMTGLFPLQAWSPFHFLKQLPPVKMKYLHISHLLKFNSVWFAISSFLKSCASKNYISECVRCKFNVKGKWFKDFSII